MKLGLDFSVELKDSAIQKDIELFYTTFARRAISEAADQIVKFARREMAGYYNEYSPEYYDRTGQMLDLSYTRFTIGFGKNHYEGGIITRSGFTDHTPKGITEEQIYENVWTLGTHGVRADRHYDFKTRKSYSTYETIQGEPNRFGKIEEIVASSDFQNRMFKLGLDAALAQHYSVLKFS